MPGNKKLFLSAVSREFLAYRKLLTGDLKRPALDVAVQEDFIVTGGSTLAKLDDYIRACDGIIHLIGKATGEPPEEPAVAALLQKYPDLGTKLPPLASVLSKPQPGFSYTQWEAYLA
ncbi:MAG TPA: tetratricopeptide repeat protein, partial [Thermoanaerobaculia bacterium]